MAGEYLGQARRRAATCWWRKLHRGRRIWLEGGQPSRGLCCFGGRGKSVSRARRHPAARAVMSAWRFWRWGSCVRRSWMGKRTGARGVRQPVVRSRKCGTLGGPGGGAAVGRHAAGSRGDIGAVSFWRVAARRSKQGGPPSDWWVSPSSRVQRLATRDAHPPDAQVCRLAGRGWLGARAGGGAGRRRGPVAVLQPPVGEVGGAERGGGADHQHDRALAVAERDEPLAAPADQPVPWCLFDAPHALDEVLGACDGLLEHDLHRHGQRRGTGRRCRARARRVREQVEHLLDVHGFLSPGESPAPAGAVARPPLHDAIEGDGRLGVLKRDAGARLAGRC